jgi:hypothetical protein
MAKQMIHTIYSPPGCVADSQGYTIDYHLLQGTTGSDSPRRGRYHTNNIHPLGVLFDVYTP